MADFAVPPGQDEAQERMAKADNYNRWLLERGRHYLGKRVLDFGAGLGVFTDLVAEGREIVALEPDPAFVLQLRERFADRPEVTVVGGDESELGPDDAGFDTVICLNVLEHIRDDVETLRRIRARLVPGGFLLLLVPAHEVLFGEIDRNVGHERRYRRRVLAERLRRAELDVVELRHVNPLGALGWLLSSRILRRSQVPEGALSVYDKLVPLLRRLDVVPLPFGLSLWAVARRPSTAS
jgi:SAM-dependent methyltransferase